MWRNKKAICRPTTSNRRNAYFRVADEIRHTTVTAWPRLHMLRHSDSGAAISGSFSRANPVTLHNSSQAAAIGLQNSRMHVHSTSTSQYANTADLARSGTYRRRSARLSTSDTSPSSFVQRLWRDCALTPIADEQRHSVLTIYDNNFLPPTPVGLWALSPSRASAHNIQLSAKCFSLSSDFWALWLLIVFHEAVLMFLIPVFQCP